MKITCNKESLNWGTQTALRAVSAKNNFLMNSFLMITREHWLEISGTDLEISITCQVPGEIIEQGTVLLPAKYFSDIVRFLPAGDVVLEVCPENFLTHIKYDKADVKLYGADPAQFPKLPVLPEINFYQIDPVLFKKMVRQVAFALGHADSRPVFNGILMEIDGQQGLTMVSTDTHRIAWCRGNLTVNAKQQACSLIVPGRTMQEVARIINPQAPLAIGLMENQVIFVQDQLKIFSRLIEGQYIDYRQYVPQTWKTRMCAELQGFTRCVERAGVLTRGEDLRNKPSFITFAIEENLLIVSSHTAEVGQIREEMIVETEGAPLKIAFNARYVLDALRVMDTPQICFEFVEAHTPAILRPLADDSFYCLLLPVRFMQD
jgi:DNA polymerase-3 subunit beta